MIEISAELWFLSGGETCSSAGPTRHCLCRSFAWISITKLAGEKEETTRVSLARLVSFTLECAAKIGARRANVEVDEIEVDEEEDDEQLDTQLDDGHASGTMQKSARASCEARRAREFEKILRN